MKRLLLAALLLLVTACAGHTKIPDPDRLRLERTLPGRTYYLRHAMYVGPFWADTDKVLLSDGVPGEIPWVVNPAGKPMEPGAPTAVIPAGTRVRVAELELPTGYNVTTRNAFGPRYHPWLFLDVEGLPRNPRPVLLLQREADTYDAMIAEIGRFLSESDLEPVLSQLPRDVRRAIDEKRLVEGMNADAVAMAWGWPERKTLTPTPEGRREEWVWPGGERRATLVGDRLISWEGESVRVPTAE